MFRPGPRGCIHLDLSSKIDLTCVGMVSFPGQDLKIPECLLQAAFSEGLEWFLQGILVGMVD